MTAVLAALPQELGPLRKRMAAKRAGAPGAWIAGSTQGGSILALTGMGRDSAEAMTERLMDRYPVETVISTGFAGALSGDLRPGQLVASSRVCASGGFPDIPLEGALLTTAVARAGGALLPCVSVTVPTAASSRDSRRHLRLTHEALSVDMESYWIARAALARGKPCLVIRAILDTEEQDIPVLDTGGAGPAAASLLMLAAFFRAPRSFALLPSLWRRSLLAANRLAAFLAGFIQAIAESGGQGGGK